MLLFSLLFLLTASAQEEPNVGIINGTVAKIHDHPWMVSTWGYSVLEGMKCTAFLIDLDWVITSGYCMRSDIRSIRAGSNDFHDQHVHINVTQKIRHPNYTVAADGTLVNDLALLHLAKKISGSNIAPIRLPEPHAPVPEGVSVNVTGWGVISEGKMTNILHVTDVVVTSKEKCKAAYRNYNLTVTDVEQFCVGTIGDTKGSCNGDGGGPVELNKTAIGLISWGLHGCSTSKMPGVVTNLANYVNWIRETIKNNA